jgi:hypothetical protein
MMQFDEFEKFVKARSKMGDTTYIRYRSNEKANLPINMKLVALKKSGMKINIEYIDPPHGLF